MTQAEEPRLERVVVLEGGISSEREVSLPSETTGEFRRRTAN